jgi:hypothetical protein
VRDSRLSLILAALAAAAILAGGAVPPATSFAADTSDLAVEETICAAHASACAVTAPDRAKRLRMTCLAVSASPSKPVPVSLPICVPETDDTVAADRPLVRWCMAHSTSTSLV